MLHLDSRHNRCCALLFGFVFSASVELFPIGVDAAMVIN